MALDLTPDEVPTANAIAVAVVAAAKVLGEDPSALGQPGAWLRARYPALKALTIFYGSMPLTALGRCVGIPTGVHQRLKSSQDARWWPTLGEEAFNAAINALGSV